MSAGVDTVDEGQRSDETTRGVRVEVESFYDAERSVPADRYFFFAYRVRITNVGDQRVQLVSRRWRIIDADGTVQEVEGPGVVGVQPVLAAGQSYEYTSFCPLRTPLGWMEGAYSMVGVGREKFEALVGRFALEAPHTVN